jgi:hypothetical protein
MRFLVVLTLLVLVFLTTPGAADSHRPTFSGAVGIAIEGWGSVEPGKGFVDHRVRQCRRASCSGLAASARSRRVRLRAAPAAGWRFVYWRGACKGRGSRCTIDRARRSAAGSGIRATTVRAVFIAVAPGLTRSNPIRMGQRAYIGSGFQLQVNSFAPDVQLSPPPPAGAEYVTASVMATYVFGWWGDISVLPVYLDLIGSHNIVYGSGNCPNDGPPPSLGSVTPSGVLYSGQSAIGNVCWKIPSDDTAALELHIHSDFDPFTPPLWFSLH